MASKDSALQTLMASTCQELTKKDIEKWDNWGEPHIIEMTLLYVCVWGDLCNNYKLD